ASISKLDGDQTAAKAARQGVNLQDYKLRNGRHRPGLDIWSEGRYEYSNSDGDRDTTKSKSEFGLLRLGADYLVSQRLLVGALLQFDHLHEEGAFGGANDPGYKISGHGWMAGPYAEFELARGLYFDAKALAGRSTNDISPFNTYTDTFETSRWLVAARLTGSWHWQSKGRSTWHLSPRAEVVWFSEESESYTDSKGVLIDGQQVGLGRVKVGPEISYRHVTNRGTRIEPRLSVKGLWSFGDDVNARPVDSSLDDNVRDDKLDPFQFQFGAGLVIELDSGVRVDLKGTYTGLGGSGDETAGGKVDITIPLQKR
ncbi:MAG: autotransporter outer membrane beta-barrel domain-containing protein, partial [Hyphomicrobiaceae bacterium]